MKKSRKPIEQNCRGGFSLIELMVAVSAFAFVIAASFSTYVYFINSSTRESASTSQNADVETSLKLLENDLRMAGFGLPKETRIASHHACPVTNENFCKTNTDRIFVADGWEILRDFTDNQADDGQILVTPTNYYSKISDAKYNDTYHANLASSASSGASSITVDKLNIDSADEYNTADDDIKANKALIISDGTHVEGHRIYQIPSGTTINFISSETLIETYDASNSFVVPAIAWYVRQDPDGKKYPDGSKVYWLYRNQNRVIPYVDDLQISYGYDAEPNDPTKGGIQSADWADVIPPPTNPDGASSFDFGYLKAVRITLKMKFMDKKDPTKTIITDFSKTVDLKN
jgi:prepilin-type N-terminal cleavage/methylation domain-containing protein